MQFLTVVPIDAEACRREMQFAFVTLPLRSLCFPLRLPGCIRVHHDLIFFRCLIRSIQTLFWRLCPFQLYLSACHHELRRGIGKLVHELVERDLGERPYFGDPPRACACYILRKVHYNCRTSAVTFSASTTALGERPSGKGRGQMHARAINWQQSSLSRESRNSS